MFSSSWNVQVTLSIKNDSSNCSTYEFVYIYRDHSSVLLILFLTVFQHFTIDAKMQHKKGVHLNISALLSLNYMKKCSVIALFTYPSVFTPFQIEQSIFALFSYKLFNYSISSLLVVNIMLKYFNPVKAIII